MALFLCGDMGERSKGARSALSKTLSQLTSAMKDGYLSVEKYNLVMAKVKEAKQIGSYDRMTEAYEARHGKTH